MTRSSRLKAIGYGGGFPASFGGRPDGHFLGLPILQAHMVNPLVLGRSQIGSVNLKLDIAAICLRIVVRHLFLRKCRTYKVVVQNLLA
jgi:hypothetical protein